MGLISWAIASDIRARGQAIRQAEARRKDDELREREVRALETIAEAKQKEVPGAVKR